MPSAVISNSKWWHIPPQPSLWLSDFWFYTEAAVTSVIKWVPEHPSWKDSLKGPDSSSEINPKWRQSIPHRFWFTCHRLTLSHLHIATSKKTQDYLSRHWGVRSPLGRWEEAILAKHNLALIFDLRWTILYVTKASRLELWSFQTDIVSCVSEPQAEIF